jgi:hypothetical protein
MKRLIVLLGAGGALMLASCESGKDPEVIHATSDEISIVAWGWSRPDSIASSHCRRFDKEAVYRATMPLAEYDDTRTVIYSCQWPNFGG